MSLAGCEWSGRIVLWLTRRVASRYRSCRERVETAHGGRTGPASDVPFRVGAPDKGGASSRAAVRVRPRAEGAHVCEESSWQLHLDFCDAGALRRLVWTLGAHGLVLLAKGTDARVRSVCPQIMCAGGKRFVDEPRNAVRHQHLGHLHLIAEAIVPHAPAKAEVAGSGRLRHPEACGSCAHSRQVAWRWWAIHPERI